MSDKEKEEFTFDENDDFPETDLSGIFADSEEEADAEREDAVESAPPEPETVEDFGLNDDVEPPPPAEEDPLAATKGGGGSRTRILLLILLLVIVGAAGLYYMRLPEESPFETQAVPTSQQVVAVPPPKQEAKPAMADQQVEGEQTAAAAAGEKPAAEPAADQSANASAAMSSEAPASPPATGGEETSAESPAGTEAPVVESETATDEVRPGDAAPTEAPAEQQAQVQADAETPAPQPAQEPVVYQLDAGAFLFPAQRDEVKKKIIALGYEPVETEVKASVRLIRLRVGGFPENEVAAKLAEVRRIAPDAFSVLREGQQVIYAGAFANQDNVQRLSARLREAGFQVTEEPVKVEKVLSRIRFGGFADDEAAEAAAQKAEDAGIPARVVGQ